MQSSQPRTRGSGIRTAQPNFCGAGGSMRQTSWQGTSSRTHTSSTSSCSPASANRWPPIRPLPPVPPATPLSTLQVTTILNILSAIEPALYQLLHGVTSLRATGSRMHARPAPSCPPASANRWPPIRPLPRVPLDPPPSIPQVTSVVKGLSATRVAPQ